MLAIYAPFWLKGGGLVGTDEGETCFGQVGWVRLGNVSNKFPFGTITLSIGNRWVEG